MLALAQDDVFATRFVRKLRGGSQPVLAEASDGFSYVVKFSNNLQGPNLAFNESMGTELYRSLGLPVALWRQVAVTDSFIDANRACWMETETGLRRPEAGKCFASRYVGGEGTRLYEILPGTYINRVKNREDFCLAWLVDVCADHRDSRQAIFRELPGGDLTATFVDHGHMFGGADQLQPRSRCVAYLDARIYPETDREQFLLKLDRVLGSLDALGLCKEIDALPDEWKRESAIRGLMHCLERLASRDFVTATVDTIADCLLPVDRREKTGIQYRREPCSTSVLCHGLSTPVRAA